MTFQFLFTFIVSAKGLPCAVASKAAGQVVGSLGLLSARLLALHGQMASASQPVWCLLSALGRQLGLLASPSTGWMDRKPQIWLRGDTIGLGRCTDLPL